MKMPLKFYSILYVTIHLTSSALCQSAVEVRCAGCKTEYWIIKQLAEEFELKHPITITAMPIGNKDAITRLSKNQISMAFTCDSHTNLIAKHNIPVETTKYWASTMIAKDPIVIIAHKDIGIHDLSTTQLHDIFTGKATNWNEVGGADVTIHPVCVDNSKVESGIVDVFKELVLANDESFTTDATLIDDPNAIGYYCAATPGAISFLPQRSCYQPFHNIIRINGIEPTIPNILSGEYPLVSTYYIIHDRTDTYEPAMFIDFIKSEKGAKIIDQWMLSTFTKKNVDREETDTLTEQ